MWKRVGWKCGRRVLWSGRVEGKGWKGGEVEVEEGGVDGGGRRGGG